MTTDFRALCAELTDALDSWLQAFHLGGVPPQDGADAKLITRARTALAQPEAEGPTDEELLGLDDLSDAWNAQADAVNTWDELGIDEIIWFAQRQALARWGRPTPEPVLVSERLPEPVDCDAEGRCWVWDWLGEDWKLLISAMLNEHGWADTYWLPHWALPLPASKSAEAS